MEAEGEACRLELTKLCSASSQVMGQCGQREEAHQWLGRLEEAGYRPNARTLKGGDRVCVYLRGRGVEGLRGDVDGGWWMVDAGLVKVAASAEEAEQLVRQVAEDDTQAGVAGLYFAVACALCREGRWQEASYSRFPFTISSARMTLVSVSQLLIMKLRPISW